MVQPASAEPAPPAVLLPVAVSAAGPPDARPAMLRLVEAFLSGRNARTLRAYRQDLEDFAAFAGVAQIAEAAGFLLGRGPGEANALALDYRNHLLTRKLAPATINRRLAALRSLVKLGRLLGLVCWALEIEGVKAETYRDTRGPGTAGVGQLLAELGDCTDAKALRDRAMVRLLFDLALRRFEVVGVDVADIDLEAGTLAVLGKGRTQKVPLTLPAPTRAALSAWLAVRGLEPGPLFRSLDRAKKGSGRLTGQALYAIVRGLGEKAGIRARPHGLRHAAITEALDRTRGDVRAVQRFSRHRDVRIVERYDDNRKDLAGQVARKVAARVNDRKGNVKRKEAG